MGFSKKIFFRATRTAGATMTLAITALCMGFSGCPEREEGAFFSGVVQGIANARQHYDSDGDECGTVQPIPADQNGRRRGLNDLEKVTVGCRVGFSSFRLGQIIKERNQDVELCRRLPERVNQAITTAYGLPVLTAALSARVVTTCREGFAHPRPAQNTRVALESIFGFYPDLAGILDFPSDPTVLNESTSPTTDAI